MAPNIESDQILLARFIRGDEEAYRVLVTRYSALVLGVCRRILSDHHAAEDSFQATFVALARHAKTIRNHRSLASWLYGVAYRVALRQRTKQHRRSEQLGVDMSTIADSSLSEVTSRCELELLDEELNRLPSKLREPIVLHYLMGKPQQVVADELGLTPSTLKGRLQRGRNRLRLSLAARGVSLCLALVAAKATAHAVGRAEMGPLVDAAIASGLRAPAGAGAAAGSSFTYGVSEGISMSHLTLRCAATVFVCGAIVALLTMGTDDRTYAQVASDVTPAVAPVRPHGDDTPAIRIAQATQGKSRTKNPLVLNYGDGKPDGRKSLGGSGEVIRFALPTGTERVRTIKIHGSRYGYPRPPKEDFHIIFLNEDMTEVLHKEAAPYSLFRRGPSKWVTVRLKEPRKVTKRFWVVLDFHAERTKGVYVSYDTSTKGEHSRIGLPPEQKARQVSFAGDWMIQALLTKPTADDPQSSADASL